MMALTHGIQLLDSFHGRLQFQRTEVRGNANSAGENHGQPIYRMIWIADSGRRHDEPRSMKFANRQQAFVAGDQPPRGIDKRWRIHWPLFRFQFRISGMSSPCLSM